jgi:hypothetical protein
VPADAVMEGLPHPLAVLRRGGQVDAHHRQARPERDL